MNINYNKANIIFTFLILLFTLKTEGCGNDGDSCTPDLNPFTKGDCCSGYWCMLDTHKCRVPKCSSLGFHFLNHGNNNITNSYNTTKQIETNNDMKEIFNEFSEVIINVNKYINKDKNLDINFKSENTKTYYPENCKYLPEISEKQIQYMLNQLPCCVFNYNVIGEIEKGKIRQIKKTGKCVTDIFLNIFHNYRCKSKCPDILKNGLPIEAVYNTKKDNKRKI